MLDGLRSFFAETGFVPHGYCLLWRADLIALHIVSDVLIVVSYLTIPCVIWKVVRARSDIRHAGLALLFAGFITACALTHLFGILTMYRSAYAEQGLVKAACAMLSLVTAVYAWRLMPTLISMPGPEDFERRTRTLTEEVARRRAVENELREAHENLRKLNERLEQRVSERTEDLLRANRELEQYAYVASHDLRAPLRALATLPGWLRETIEREHGSVHADMAIDLDEMEKQASRLDTLLNDLLDYARIGQQRASACNVDPHPIIRETVAVCALPRGFTVHVPDDLPHIHCIPAEFALVMRNLISNAVKHHDGTAGAIHIRADDDAGQVRFYVEDDGPGIAPDYAEKVFQMFSTLKPRDEVEGSGMGLAMVRKIVERAGGYVRLAVRAAADPRGTCFELTFPAARRT